MHQFGPVADPILLGDAASALLGAARVLDNGVAGDATATAWRLVELAGWQDVVTALPDGGHRRRSCCLYYRTPHGGLCGDCALSEQPVLRAGGPT